MITPSSWLFYNIIEKMFGATSSIALRGIVDVIMIEKGDSREEWCTTLCVTDKGVIYVNKEFWFKYVKSEVDVGFILLHELFHVLLGDTTKKVAEVEIDLSNFTQDARINAAVSFFMINHSGTSLMMYSHIPILTRLYRKRDVQLLGDRRIIRSSKYFKLHSTLYPDKYNILKNPNAEALSDESIRNTVKLLVPVKAMKNVTYLGSHNHDGKPIDAVFGNNAKEALAADILEKIEEMGGKGELLSSYLIKLIEENRTIQLKVLKRFAISKKLNAISVMIEEEEPATDVVPINPSKGDMAQVACGYVPVFWHNRETIWHEEEGGGCAIYIDVSGSVAHYLPKILALLRRVKRNIQTVFCFSNIICEKDIASLLRGEVETTGGTDFDCILTHAVDHSYKKFVVFTDGYASLSTENQAICKKKVKDVALILFGNGTNKDNWFSDTYKKTFKLEDLIK